MTAEEISPAPGSRLATATLVGLTLCAVVAIMFLPLLLIAAFYADPSRASAATGEVEATVGIAVIVRATARRLFRSGAQNVLRVGLGAFTRTTARTMTRRLMRIGVRQLAMLTIASLVRDIGSSDDDREAAEAAAETDAQTPLAQSNLVAVLLGFAGLFCSFWVILILIGEELATTVLQGLPAWQGAALVALPLLLHAVITAVASRFCGVQAHFRTKLDGLLLQGYFTGAASFLPLTTDVEYHGETRQKARTATIVLLTLLGFHFAIAAVGHSLGSAPLQFFAAAILMYAFVFSFPLEPLEGHHLWKQNKLLWLAVWLPTLIVFANDIPNGFSDVL